MIEQIFRDRVAHLREDLHALLDLDMLLAYSDDPLEAGAVRYLTDFDVYAMYALVAIPKRGDVALVFGLHHSAYLVRVKEVANADYYFGTYQPGDLCRELLLESGPGGTMGRIGLVGGKRMFRKIESNLRKTLPDATFVDVDSEFWMVANGESEQSRNDTLARLRRAAIITRESLDFAERRWQGSRSGSELAADIGLAARRRGADILNREMVRVALAMGEPLPPYLSSDPSNVRHSSQALAIEIRTAHRGVNAAVARTFVASESGLGLAADLASLYDKHRSLCQLLKTGTSIDDIVEAAAASGCSTSIANAAALNLGSAIGFSARQEPFLRQGATRPLVKMSAFVLETRWMRPQIGSVRFSDTVLVTDDGGEILTDKNATV